MGRVAELTEPLVIIVGAVCEKCGKELDCPGYGLPEDSTALSPPVYPSAIRTSTARHANEQGPFCGGRVLFATEPYEEAEDTLEAVVRLGMEAIYTMAFDGDEEKTNG